MKSIVVLISGRGSNLQALIEASRADDWPGRINAVISNRADAAGLELARQADIPTAVVSHRDHADRAAFDHALAAEIDRHGADLVVLAGFMRILGTPFVERYSGQMINIHPSLLPAFPGLDTHQQALDAGVRLHGATVHLVTPTLDHGPILLQGAVPVLDGDDAARLAERVLRVEHRIFPKAVRWMIESRVRVDAAGRVHVDGVSADERLEFA